MATTKEPGIAVESAVTKPEKTPIVLLTINGQRAFLTVAQARKVAADIVQQASRAEADAMVYRFFDSQKFPAGAAQDLMGHFRVFRHELDTEAVEGHVLTPSLDPKPH